MPSTLVTGGAGFLGSHLCERLLNEGYFVICVDNFFSSSKANILHLLDNPRFEIIRHDVTFPLFLEADRIYNLACPASPIHYQSDPVQTVKTSVHGAINVLGLAKRTGARIFQASTSEVYGDPEIHPQTEDYLGRVNPIGVRACYDEGKRCAETLFFDYHRQHHVDIRVARIFNTYGPRMSRMMAELSDFIVQALPGSDITIFGDGTQTRSFCFVGDLVEAIVAPWTATKWSGPVNLGNPIECTMLNLPNWFLSLSVAVEIIHMPLPRRSDAAATRRSYAREPLTRTADAPERGARTHHLYFRDMPDLMPAPHISTQLKSAVAALNGADGGRA